VENNFFWSHCFENGIISIQDLLDKTGNLLTFPAFSLKYSCKTSSLQYCQMLSAIPIHLLSIAKHDNILHLNESTQINFGTARSRDFYKLLVSRTHTHAISKLAPNVGVKKILLIRIRRPVFSSHCKTSVRKLGYESLSLD